MAISALSGPRRCSRTLTRSKPCGWPWKRRDSRSISARSWRRISPNRRWCRSGTEAGALGRAVGGGRGPVSLLTDDQPWWTHGAFSCRDSLIGPLYLLLQEVLDPDEHAAEWMLQYSADLFHVRNVALSQPYYSEHALFTPPPRRSEGLPRGVLQRLLGSGGPRDLLVLGALPPRQPPQDPRGGLVPDADPVDAVPGAGRGAAAAPGHSRAWLEDGQRIAIRQAASYFGPFSLEVVSEVEQGRIPREVTCDAERKPKTVTIRLPHPDGQDAARVRGELRPGHRNSERRELHRPGGRLLEFAG